MSKQSFADLGVSRAVAQTLERRGFKAPFAIQEKVIGDVLDGRDVLAKSLGSSNHANVVQATIAALTQLRPKEEIFRLRGKTIKVKTEDAIPVAA